METAIVILIVALASVFLIRSLWKTAHAEKGCNCGTGKCPAAEICQEQQNRRES